MSTTPRKLYEKLWNKTEVPPDGDQRPCWPYGGSLGKKGAVLYAPTHRGVKKQFLAHRVAWEADNGPIPEGHVVFHTCGNMRCANPAHLRCVPKKDHPGMERGRLARSHRSRVPYESVAKMRKLREEGLPIEKLAERFRISKPYVRKILRGERRAQPRPKLAGGSTS